MMRWLAVLVLVLSWWFEGIALLAQDQEERKAHAAAAKGDLESVKQYIAKGGSVDARGSDGNPLLIVGAHRKRQEVVDYLLDQGAKVNIDNISRNERGNHFLYYVVLNGWLDILRKALPKMAQEGRKVNLRTFRLSTRPTLYGNNTTLFLATEKGHLNIVQFLKKEGVPLDMRSVDFRSERRSKHMAIHTASRRGHLDLVKYFESEGISLRSKGIDGDEPIHYAAYGNQMEVVDYLLERGVPVDVANDLGQTPALRSGHGLYNKGFLDYWVERKANLFIEDNQGNSVVGNVVRKGRLPLLKQMVSNGFDYKRMDNDLNTLVHLAAMSRAWREDLMDFLEYLVGELKLKVTNKNAEGSHPHHFVSGSLPALKYLENKGANLKSRGKNGNQLIHIALKHDVDMEVVRFLVEERRFDVNATNHLRQTPLLVLSSGGRVKKGTKEALDYLLSKGAWLNVRRFRPMNGNTVLHNFSSMRREQNPLNIQAPEIVEVLLDKGARVNVLNDYRRAPVHLAAQAGNDDVVQQLLNQGAKVDDTDKAGKTPLIYALERGYEQMSIALVEATKLSPNKTYSNGNTLVHWLASAEPTSFGAALTELEQNQLGENTQTDEAELSGKNFQTEMVKRLQAKGAALHLPNDYGQYPIHLAAQSGNLDMMTYFVLEKVDLARPDKKGNDALYYAVRGAGKAQAKPSRRAQSNKEAVLLRYGALVGELLKTKVFGRKSVADALGLARRSKLDSIAKQLMAAQ